MSKIKIIALDSDYVEGLQNGGKDTFGNLPECTTSAGSGAPCRHCLKEVEKGDDFLILSHQPFAKKQVNTEVGPIFIHATKCDRAPETSEMPKMFLRRDQCLIRVYNKYDRIVYTHGGVTDSLDVKRTCEEILNDKENTYIHIRSADFNCFQCRVERVKI